MQMYSLTAMTGREAAASRTVVIGTVEFNWRVWMIIVWTSPLGMIFAAMFWPLIGQVAVFLVPVVPSVAIFLIHRRTRDGLQVATYRAIWDKKKSVTNEFMLCGQPIDINPSDFRQVLTAAAPYAPDTAPAVALADDWVEARKRAAPASRRRTVSGFSRTEDPAEAARERRVAAAAGRTPAPEDAFGMVEEPARVAAPAPMAMAPSRDSATAHVPDARLDAAYIGREGIGDAPDVAEFFDTTTARAGHRKAAQ